MPRGTYLTEEEKGKILAFMEEEVGVREIARRLGRSHKVILNFLHDPVNYGKNKKGGPKKKLSPRTERVIVKAASNSLKSCNQIKSELNLNISRWTVRRVLKNNPNIVRQKLKSAPKLLPRHNVARLEYARANMHRDWKSVIFSDEKKFNLDGPDGYNSYWRDLRKEPQYFSKRNFGGGSVMVWGGFCIDGMLQLAFPSKRMDSDEYIAILGSNLLSFIHEHNTINWTFQQDNAAIHTSRKTMSWLQTNTINVIKWPACSPDQNPMENIWAIIVRKVYAENRQYQNILELKNAIIRASNEISERIFQKLIESMSDRIFQVITKRGGLTNY